MEELRNLVYSNEILITLGVKEKREGYETFVRGKNGIISLENFNPTFLEKTRGLDNYYSSVGLKSGTIILKHKTAINHSLDKALITYDYTIKFRITDKLLFIKKNVDKAFDVISILFNEIDNYFTKELNKLSIEQIRDSSVVASEFERLRGYTEYSDLENEMLDDYGVTIRSISGDIKLPRELKINTADAIRIKTAQDNAINKIQHEATLEGVKMDSTLQNIDKAALLKTKELRNKAIEDGYELLRNAVNRISETGIHNIGDLREAMGEIGAIRNDLLLSSGMSGSDINAVGGRPPKGITSGNSESKSGDNLFAPLFSESRKNKEEQKELLSNLLIIIGMKMVDDESTVEKVTATISKFQPNSKISNLIGKPDQLDKFIEKLYKHILG